MKKMEKREANHPALSPIGFIERAATVYGDSTSVIYGNLRFTWSQTYERCRRLASALVDRNISPQDVVSVVAPNVPAIYEMHFAVPMAGAVLNCINIRLDARAMAAQFAHCRPKMVFVDYQFAATVSEALKELSDTVMVVIAEDDGDEANWSATYEGLVREGDPLYEMRWPDDEWEPIALNYTSGTTSAPKGVVHSHRGIYTLATDSLVMWGLTSAPKAVHLWTLPMFHANGWCFTWGMAAVGGTTVCLRRFHASDIYSAIAEHGVTHLCGAPVVLSMIANAPNNKSLNGRRVEVLTAGSPPPAAVLKSMEDVGFSVTHGYGLTETAGLVICCAWKPEWDSLPAEERARLKARQGVRVPCLTGVDVVDPVTMKSVARDGMSLGEIVLRGPSIMKGYLGNPEATEKALHGGWLHTGDVAVMHADGYLEIKDRSKDVIISGGENISSVEIESVLYSVEGVMEAAVVAMPHPHWGETPCAFVVPKTGAVLSEERVLELCRRKLPGYMLPKRVVVVKESDGGLPKTSTGKIQKFMLRDLARSLSLSSPISKL